MTFPKKTDNIEFIDAEDQTYYQKEQAFSHQSLVMESMRKCLELGSHEMRPGWFNKKIDIRGNITLTYIEDTRSKFIESVKSAEMVMTCDYDKTTKTNINNLKQILKNKKQQLLKDQWSWYSQLDKGKKDMVETKYGEIQGIGFNRNLGWWEIFVSLELKIYRSICTELNNLTKRLGFYELRTIQE